MKRRTKLSKKRKSKIVKYIKVIGSSFLSVFLLDNFYSNYNDVSYIVGAIVGSVLTFMYVE